MSGVITLTKEERLKFAAWLRQDSEVSHKIIEQMEKLNTIPPLIRKLNVEVEAFQLVAEKLDSMEEQTISG